MIKEFTTETIIMLSTICMFAILMLILLIIVIVSIIKTQTNTRKLTEQNERIIQQNDQIISSLTIIIQQQYTGNTNQYEYAKYISNKYENHKNSEEK